MASFPEYLHSRHSHIVLAAQKLSDIKHLTLALLTLSKVFFYLICSTSHTFAHTAGLFFLSCCYWFEQGDWFCLTSGGMQQEQSFGKFCNRAQSCSAPIIQSICCFLTANNTEIRKRNQTVNQLSIQVDLSTICLVPDHMSKSKYCIYVYMCVSQSNQRPSWRAMEENAKWGATGVHCSGQSSGRRAEKNQPRLLETQTNQLGK